MRKFAKTIFVYFCYYTGLNFFYSFFCNNKIFVLIYHSVTSKNDNAELMSDLYPGLSIDVKRFEEQIKYLKKRGHTFLKMSDLTILKHKKIRKPTIIYFDDGFKNNLINALPILQHNNIPATIFITTGFIDKTHFLWTLKHRYFLQKKNYSKDRIKLERARLKRCSFSEREKELEKIYSKDNFIFNLKDFKVFLNWNDVISLSKNNIEIGSHSVSHKNLIECDNKELNFEIKQSKDIIEKKIGKEIHSFSYPHGRWNNKINNILRQNGFKFSASSGVGLNKKQDVSKDFFAVKNIAVRPNESLIYFKIKLYIWNILKLI